MNRPVDTMPELWNENSIARFFSRPLNVVRYAIRRGDVQPIARTGTVALFDMAGIELVRLELAAIDKRPTFHRLNMHVVAQEDSIAEREARWAAAGYEPNDKLRDMHAAHKERVAEARAILLGDEEDTD